MKKTKRRGKMFSTAFHTSTLLLLKTTMVILCCCHFKVDAVRRRNMQAKASECNINYFRLRNTLNPNLSTRVAARKTKDINNNIASVPECFFNLARDVRDFTKSTELDTNVTDEEIISLMMGKMTTKSSFSSSLSLSTEKNQNSSQQELISSGRGISVPDSDPSYPRRLAGDQAACYDSTINMIVESISLLMALVGLGGVGKAVGRAAAKKLKKDGLNEAKGIGQISSSATVDEKAQVASEIILLTFTDIGFNSFIKIIADEVEWYEWALLVVSITAQLALLIASGGASLLLQLVALGAALVSFGIAVADVVEDCEDVPEIGCLSFPGFVFYEDLNSDGGNLFGWDDATSFETIANECRSESFCKGFNTLRWRKSLIFPYDEWVPISGSCAGVFVKEDVEICRNQIDGFKFFPLFDSPGNTVSSQPLMSLEDLAEICQNDGDACEGFNTEGDKKSIIQSIPTWSRSQNTCQGLFVKKSIDICPSAQGYTFYNDFISEGSVLVTLTEAGGFIDELVAECDERGSACKGFTTFGSLKSGIAAHRDWTPSNYTCYGTYVKADVLVDVPIDCNDLDGYEYYPNKDSTGNDIEMIEGASKSDLAQACNANPDCEGFNTNFYLKHQIKSPNQMESNDNVKGLCQGLYVKQGIIYPPDASCQSGGRVNIDVNSYKRFTCYRSYPGKMKFIWRTLATTDWGFDDDEYYIRVMKDGSAGEEVYNSGKKTLTQGSGSGSIETIGGSNGFVVEFDCANSFFRCEGGDFEFKLVSCDCPGGADPILNCDTSSISQARDAVCPAPTPAPTTLSPTISPATTLCPNKYVRVREVCAIPESESDGTVEIKIEMNGAISWPKYEGCPGAAWSGACELPNESVVGCYELAGSEQRLFTEAQSISVQVIDEDTFSQDDWYFEIPETWYDLFDCSNSEFEITYYSNLIYPGFKIIVDVTVNPDVNPTQFPTQSPISSDYSSPDILMFCFSERVTVQVRGKGSIPIKDLRVGDYVMTGNIKEMYQPVYAFAHRDEFHSVEFLRISIVNIDNHDNINRVPSKRNYIEMTGNHLIYVLNKNGRPIRADSLAVGDVLYGNNAAGMDGDTITMRYSITKIEKVLRRGYYAPLTPHGSIIVNGLLASTYVGVSSKSLSEYVQIKGINLPLLQADGVHIALSPLRLAYRGINLFSMLNKSIRKENSVHISDSNYNRGSDNGKQLYISICLRFAWWVEEQYIFVQVIIFCLAFITFGFSTLMEKAVINSTCFTIIITCIFSAILLLSSRKKKETININKT